MRSCFFISTLVAVAVWWPPPRPPDGFFFISIAMPKPQRQQKRQAAPTAMLRRARTWRQAVSEPRAPHEDGCGARACAVRAPTPSGARAPNDGLDRKPRLLRQVVELLVAPCRRGGRRVDRAQVLDRDVEERARERRVGRKGLDGARHSEGVGGLIELEGGRHHDACGLDDDCEIAAARRGAVNAGVAHDVSLPLVHIEVLDGPRDGRLERDHAAVGEAAVPGGGDARALLLGIEGGFVARRERDDHLARIGRAEGDGVLAQRRGRRVLVAVRLEDRRHDRRLPGAVRANLRRSEGGAGGGLEAHRRTWSHVQSKSAWLIADASTSAPRSPCICASSTARP